MPIIQLQHPADALDAERKEALAQHLTDVLLHMEGDEGTPGGRGFATVIFQPVASGDWWIGGRSDDTHVTAPGRFLAHVTIPEGYMNQAHKTEVHADVTRAITDTVDPDGSGPATSIQVIIDEVPEGNWGAGGHTITLDHIADVVGLPKDGPRWQWVEKYFAAKSRADAAAGYPADRGGLLYPRPTRSSGISNSSPAAAP